MKLKVGDVYQDDEGWTVLIVDSGRMRAGLQGITIGRDDTNENTLYHCHFHGGTTLVDRMGQCTYLGNIKGKLQELSSELLKARTS